MKSKVITIDGPAGSGKTTLAHLLSKRLNIRCLHT
ncbi:MAG: (d)CMP kinase, partial [Desulfatiglandales bacterium]